jgi:hypothetical protein
MHHPFDGDDGLKNPRKMFEDVDAKRSCWYVDPARPIGGTGSVNWKPRRKASYNLDILQHFAEGPMNTVLLGHASTAVKE